MTSVGSGALRSGMTQSCGCLQRDRLATSNAARVGRSVPASRKQPAPGPVFAGGSVPVHQNTKNRARKAGPETWRSSSSAYGSWINMIYRCTNPDHPRFADWGGRGITIDPRWRDFDNFLADMGERPQGMSIERKDNNGPYASWNCVWATQHQQMMNTRATKLTPEVIAEIEYLRATGLTLRMIGETLGLNRKTVSRALSGKTRQRSGKL